MQEEGDDQHQQRPLSSDGSVMSTSTSGGDSDDSQINPWAGIQGLPGAFPHLVGATVLQRVLRPRRRLQFNPFHNRGTNRRRTPQNRPLDMAAAARADLRVKFGSFSGKSKEDPGCHVAQFETRWQARGFAGVYDAQAKMRQFEATFEGKAVQWFSNFVVNHFVDYEELKTAFLNRFRVEKTANDVLTKLKAVKQKKMFVEDYSQKFNRYVRRLTAQERPTDEMLAAYFVKGLREELRNVVAGVDVAGGLNELIITAARAEKRFGLTDSKHSTSAKKKKKKKGKKRRKSKDDSSDDDSDSDSDTNLDTDSSSSGDSSDSDSEEEDNKKKKHKRKSIKKSKEKTKEMSVEKAVEKKLKEMGIQKGSEKKVEHCDICVKDGHNTKDCWYNPSFRGVILERVQQKMQQNVTLAHGIFPEAADQQRQYGNQGWQRPQQNYQNWRGPGRPPFRGNFNQGGRGRFGGWQNSRPPWGANWNQQQGWSNQSNWQPPPNWNQQQNWQQPQGWNQQNWNQHGWNQPRPPQPLPQLPAPPVQPAGENKLPQSSMVNVDVCQEISVREVIAECEIACDCSKCVKQNSEVFAVTRSKAKLKSPLDWEE